MNIATGSRSGCRRYLILATFLMLAVGAAFAWRAMRPIDTTPPKPVLAKVEPDKPLFAERERQVTFVLHDDQGGIPTFFVFEDPAQKATALGINTLRGTPNERGVEIRFEAIRFRRDETDPGKLWVPPWGSPMNRKGRRRSPWANWIAASRWTFIFMMRSKFPSWRTSSTTFS